MIYKLYKTLGSNITNAVMTNELTSSKSFIFTQLNTDYQNFKKQINADEAQLEDADGNLMTAEQAKEFVLTLP